MKVRTIDLSQADIRCRVEPELREGLLNAAREDRTSVSEWLRRTLRQAVAARSAMSPGNNEAITGPFRPASGQRLAA